MITNMEKLQEVFDNIDTYDAVRVVAVFMADNGYCHYSDKSSDISCDRYLTKDGCVKCWMYHLTEEYKEKEDKNGTRK